MSAILGVYYPDGRPLDRSVLDRMIASIAHRGPDGSNTWIGASVGLAHLMLHTTPESFFEHPPQVDGTAQCVLTGDARIDNRDELIAALGIAGGVVGTPTDSDLVLAAYGAWGVRCPEYLLGDFAFAIWDARTQSVFCARDHLGVKPFYYHASDHIFAFGSEIKAVLAAGDVSRRVNEMHIANYLASLLDDTAATFYQDIRRLPPAHHLLINREGLKIQRYWALDPASEMPNRSDREYAEAFRELFTTAVRCRSRRGGPVGAMLSGGLDSSAITQVARTLHGDDAVLHTFSATFDKVKECDERFYINTLLAQPRLRPHYLPAEETGILVDLDRLLWHTDEPFIAPGLLMTWRLYDIAAHHGVRVLLDGHGGDEVVSTGDAYLKELARAGRWLTLARELKRLANLHGDTWWEWFGPYASHYLLKPVVRRAWPVQALRRRVASVRQMPPPSGSVASQASWEPFIAPNFVQRTGLAERYRSSQQHRPELALEERERHYRILASGFQPYALEVLDRVAGAFPVEPRYPFLDRRLVEFCLALPANQKLRNGWGRFILRQAMEGTLPREIQWRAGKTDFSPALTHGLRALQNNQLGITTNRDVEHLAAYVNVDALRDAARRVASSTGQASQRDVDIVLKCVILSRWLGSTHPQ